jgi:putative endonuclease
VKKPAVYILECRTGKYYTGVTSDLDGQEWEHENGAHDGFTKRNGPCTLVWHGYFQDMTQAIRFEKQVKGWRREKKRALIEGRFEDLPELSRSYSSGCRQPSVVVLRQAQDDDAGQAHLEDAGQAHLEDAGLVHSEDAE